MGNWDGFDMQAELHPGFVHDACVAEVPGRPLGPAQDFNEEALATLSGVYFKPKHTKSISRQTG